jgi:multicomponent Na+:H+ antiporter subunit G
VNPAVEWISLALAAIGTLFFISGSIGLSRLPDVTTRLHALSKADNVGLGLIVLATMLRADSIQAVFKAGLVWGLMLVTSTCLCLIIVRECEKTPADQIQSKDAS